MEQNSLQVLKGKQKKKKNWAKMTMNTGFRSQSFTLGCRAFAVVSLKFK